MGIPIVNSYDCHASYFSVQCDEEGIDEVLAYEEEQGNFLAFIVLNAENSDWDFTLIFKHSPA